MVQRTISAEQWESYVWLWFGCSWYSLDPKNSYTPKSTCLTKPDTYRLQEVNWMNNVLLISLGQSFMTYILIVPKGKHWFCFWIKIPSRERVFLSYWNVISICRKYREKRLNPFRFAVGGSSDHTQFCNRDWLWHFVWSFPTLAIILFAYVAFKR